MKTNQIFSLKRFINLIKSDLLMNYKRYGMIVLVMTLLTYVVMYLNFPKNGGTFDIERYFPFLVSFIFFSLGAWIGSSFPAFNRKNTSRNYLMTPASTFEKYTAQFIGRIIISTIVMLIIFWIDARFARFTVLHVIKENTTAIDKFSYTALYEKIKLDHVVYWTPLIFFSLVTFLFSARIYFNKHGLIKSLLALAGVFFAFYILLVIYTQIFYPGNKLFEVDATNYIVTKSIKNSDILMIALLSFSILILPVLGFFKLKEKEL